MTDEQKINFIKLMKEVALMYKQETSDFFMTIWLNVAKECGVERTVYAIKKHVTNPDVGQFMPKPADVIKVLQGGGSKDAAALACSQVEKAIRSIGHYQDVVFDDKLIHLVIEQMGGWVKVASVPTEDDLKFQNIEFTKRYAHAMQHGDISQAQVELIGYSHMQAVASGQPFTEKPVRIGSGKVRQEVIEFSNRRSIGG